MKILPTKIKRITVYIIYFNACIHYISVYPSNDCALDDSIVGNDDKTDSTSIQMVRVNLQKKVRFKLDGGVPRGAKDNMNYSVPSLPFPGEPVKRTNVLKIREYVIVCTQWNLCIGYMLKK